MLSNVSQKQLFVSNIGPFNILSFYFGNGNLFGKNVEMATG